jgi:hypothetical protein
VRQYLNRVPPQLETIGANHKEVIGLSDSRGGTRTRDPAIMSENASPADRDSSSDDAA